MSDEALAVRARHFKANWLAWAALHHFLSASLLRELLIVIVDEMSGGTLSFQQLFEDSITSGIDCMEAWLLRPLDPRTALGGYLQDRVRALVWQNDSIVHVPAQGITSPSGVSPSTLEAAIAIGIADLNWSLQNTELATHQPSLTNLLDALRKVAASVRQSPGPEFLAGLASTFELIEAPLDLLVVKHLGDLCGDADCWDKATLLYTEAARRANLPHPAAWNNLVTSLRAIIEQSRATAERNLYGPAQSAAYLGEVLNSATIQSSPLTIANASFDALAVALLAAPSNLSVQDRRATTLYPPLLQGSHNTASALRSWLGGDFSDAHRSFWAVLRRQIALGASTESRATKALYARSLIDDLASNAATQNHPETFLLATSLLLESGSCAATARIFWNEILVATYVDQCCVDFVIAHADAQRGSQPERRAVAVELFRDWATLIGLERIGVAKAMLKYVATLALQSPTSLYTSGNLGGRSLEALCQVAKKRPEIRREAIDEISAAIIEKLHTAEFWTGRRAALETASAYLDAFSEEQLKAVIDGTLSLLDGISPAAEAGPIVQPALDVLVSEPAKRLSGLVLDLGRRIVSAILRFGLQPGGGSARVFFDLHNFDAALLRDASIMDALGPTVAEVRRRSQLTNSSGVAADIQALLLAPSVSGESGVKDAITGLDRVLKSVGDSPPSMGLPFAYSALLLLAGGQQQIASDVSISIGTFRSWLDPILERVIDLWAVGKDRPVIFSTFSLPPATRPDPVIVHNWAFASILFAESLEQEDRIQKVLTEAMAQPMLADPIALARATRSAAGNVDVDTTAIRSENRDTFYSALGRRLVVLQKIEDARAREICKALLDQCFRLGPRAMDAAVFLSAVRLDIAGHVPGSIHSDYAKRLQEQNRGLRLSLTPILEMLKPTQ